MFQSAQSQEKKKVKARKMVMSRQVRVCAAEEHKQE